MCRGYQLLKASLTEENVMFLVLYQDTESFLEAAELLVNSRSTRGVKIEESLS
jgi:hypothetical protein